MRYALLALVCTACLPRPSVNVGYTAQPTQPRWLSPNAEADMLIGRLDLFGGVEATLQAGTKPAYGPLVGAAMRVW